MSNTFELLHEKVKKAIWEMGWERFRPIQDEAIKVVTGGEQDLIISAPTASGKTEAAFLPLISRHYDELKSSMAILYISPLKALINDQFGRVSRLCKEMDIPITRWHGDAEQSRKQKLLKRPRGILLITPESLEALLIRREVESRALLGGVQAVVIDEIHYFLAGERGAQLYSLLNRIEQTTGMGHLRRIALSATIGSPQAVKEWLSPTPALVEFIKSGDDGKDTLGNIFTVVTSKESPQRFEEELYRLTSRGKSLIFSNRKSSLESCCDRIKKYMEKERLPDIYRIHHGSLSKEHREETERELKESKNLAVFCTSTLELGIDIGDIDIVIFLAPPWTVSSFTQRIGRSGRKGDRPIKFAFLYEKTDDDPFQLSLVKSAALIELHLEGYCEPYSFDQTRYSCLVHQLLAYLAQRGGVKAAELYTTIVEGSFRGCLTEDDYIALLRHLKELGYIEQLTEGDIVLAVKGERVVENYKFYAVFKTPENWQVLCNGELIGEIPLLINYREGDSMIFGGKRWIIERVEPPHKRIIVIPSKGKSDVLYPKSFSLTSKEVHRKMKELYETEKIPVYVDSKTAELLEGAYSYYKQMLNNPNMLFHFAGSRVGNTIGMLLKAAGLEHDDFEIGVDLKRFDSRALLTMLRGMELTESGFVKAVAEICPEDKEINKFDDLLPANLLNKSYLKTICDVEETINFIKGEGQRQLK